MKRFLLPMICGFALLSCTRSNPAPQPEDKTEAAKNPAQESGENQKAGADAIEMSAEAQQRAGVVITPATLAPLTQYLQVPGTVQPIESSMAHIRPIARGRLLDVLVKMGDRVTSGQVLAQLDNIEAGEVAAQYNSAQAELQKLKIQLAQQQRQVERNRRLVDIGAVPQKEYELSLAEEQAMQAGIRAQESTIAGLNVRLHRFGIREGEKGDSSTMAIRASFSGVIIRMAAAPGDVVEAGAELFALADLSTVYVQAQVYEKDLGKVRVGQDASITVDSYPGERFTGRVISISDLIDPQTRSAAVRCRVANPKALLKLDMLATVQFPTSAKRALSVPADAVQAVNDKSVVFVRTSPSRFSIRQVETGLSSEGRTEIVRGLSPGDPVVSKGAFAVKSVLSSKELDEEKE